MTATESPQTPRPRSRQPGPVSRSLGLTIFASRWLQAPLYLGLIVAQFVYVVVFVVDLWHLAEGVWDGLFGSGHGLNESQIMLGVLGLIDVVMIANLLIMVIIGGYEIFVSRIGVEGHPDEPDWLNHVNANLLKVKLSISIISISSIHLLSTFIKVGALGSPEVKTDGNLAYTPQGVMWQVIIHLAFIASALALAWIDRMSRPERHAERSPDEEEPRRRGDVDAQHAAG